jgi:glycine/D-amino acid oxidase-like deaminating enzyme
VRPEEQAALEENVRRLRERGYAAEWITRDRLLAMEPDLDPARIGAAPIAWFPEEGWLDPVPYAGAMIRAAQALGARLHTGARVVGMEIKAGRVTGLRIADGTRFTANMVVNCAGRWADAVSDEPGLQIPLAPTLGFLVFTPPVAVGLRHPLHTPDANLRPDGAGRLMVRANDADALVSNDTPLGPHMPQARQVMRGAARLIPALTGVEAEAVRVAIRPIPQDGFSAVGPVPRIEGYYVAVTHSGVTLSPILAKLVAAEVMHGKACAELAEFRPARFFN